MIFQSRIKTLLLDPALVAMGLVPAAAAAESGLAAGIGAPMSWRAAWTIILLGFVAMTALFWGAVAGMVETWYRSDTFNHGFLILPICGYLIWIKRGLLAGESPQPTLWGLALIVPASFGWLLGELASVLAVQQFAFVIMLQGLFLTVLGVRIAWMLSFPLFYLFFAVPFGEFLIPPLQDLTAVFTVAFLRLFGIPVFIDGIFLSIPTGNFEVAEACSGVRFLIATLALGFLFAELTYVSRWRRAAFIALSVVVPVVANGFRAFGIVLIAYLSNNELAVGVDHIVYGWIFFAIVTVILLAIGMTFRDSVPPDPVPDIEAMRSAALRQVAPRRVIVIGLVGLAAATVAPGYAAYLANRPPPVLTKPLVAPEPGPGWRKLASARVDWAPVFPRADARLTQHYARDGKVVTLFIAYYTHERPGVEMVGSANSVTGAAWARAASRSVSLTLGDDRVEAERTRMIRRPRGWLSYHWYWIGGRYTANPYIAKMLQAFDRLMTGGGPSAVIIAGTGFDETPAEADRALNEFLTTLGPIRPMLSGLTR